MTRRERKRMSASEQVPTTRTTRHDVPTGTCHSELRVDNQHPKNDDAPAGMLVFDIELLQIR